MLKEKIKSLECMQGFIAHYMLKKRPLFREWYNDYYECHTMFKFQELGDLNQDKLIFIIRITDPTWGFFAAWKRVCMGLLVAERYKFIPVVDWTDSLYYEPNGVNGIFNPFEYYFEPVSDVSLDEANNSYNVTFYGKNSNGMLDTTYGVDKKTIDDFVRVSKKYIHFRDDIYNALAKQIESLFGSRKILGIHVRGVEWGNLNGHPIPVGLDDYVDEADKAIEKYGFEKIFLATDSEDTISFFKKKYGDNLIFYKDSLRSSSGKKVLAIYDDTIRRDENRYWLGYEVLRDMLTLSFCDGIIAGISNVSLAADVFKQAREEAWDYKYILKQELCKNGISLRKAIKLMKKEANTYQNRIKQQKGIR